MMIPPGFYLCNFFRLIIFPRAQWARGAYNSRIKNCFKRHEKQMLPKSQGKMLLAWLIGPWLRHSRALRLSLSLDPSCLRHRAVLGVGTNSYGSPGNWGRHRGLEEETESFPDISGSLLTCMLSKTSGVGSCCKSR